MLPLSYRVLAEWLTKESAVFFAGGTDSSPGLSPDTACSSALQQNVKMSPRCQDKNDDKVLSTKKILDNPRRV